MMNRLKMSLPRISRLFLYIWSGTIGLFILGVIIGSNQPNSVYPKLLSNFILVDVITGVGSFIFMCIFALLGAATNPKKRKIGLVKNTKPKTLRSNKLVWKSVWFVWILVFLLIGYIVYLSIRQNTLVANQKVMGSQNTIIPTEIPAVTPTPYSTSKPNPVYIDPDPIIACNINSNCGGGTRQMKQSECNQSTCCTRSPNCGGGAFLTTRSACSSSTCCQVGGSWSIYSSKEKCTEAQRGSGSNIVDCPLKAGSVKLTEASCDQAIYDEVYNDTYKALGGGSTPTYFPLPTEDPTITQQIIQICLDRALSNYNSAKTNCYNVARANGIISSSWTQQCVQTATENYSYEKSLCK